MNPRSFSRVHKLVFVLIALIVFVTAMPESHAATTTANVFKKVSLSKASYVQLTDANLVPSASGSTASFTFTFYNGDSTPINLVDYWARLKSKGGSKYTLTLLDADKKKKVLPKATTTLTFYSEVSSKMTLDQLVVNIIKFDFAVSGYERSIAQYSFPKGFSNHVKAGGYKSILIGNSNVNVRIDQINATKKDKNYVFNVSLVARNNGKFGVALPQYSYYVQTPSGLYKLALRNKTDETLTLEPTVLNSVRLTGNIPTSVATSGWKLVVTQGIGAAETTKTELPIVILEAPFKLTTTTTTAKASFTNDDGTYEVELKNVQRLPLNNQDQVVAELVIRNKESVNLPLPDLTGLFSIDENIKLATKLIKNNGDLGIAPGGSSVVSYVGSIPYAYQWKKFNLKLSEKENDTTIEVAEVTKSNVTPISVIAEGATYLQQSNGVPFAAEVTDVRTYTGTKNDTFVVFVDVTNKQNRSSALPVWSGYFQTADGSIFDAKVQKPNVLINPTKKEQMMVWTELPEGIDKTGIKLVLGEAYNENGLIQGTGEPTGYLRAVQLSLPNEKEATSSFKQLEVGPYTIEMNYYNAFMDGHILDADIGGKVKKNNDYASYSQSQLTLELERKDLNQILLSKTISFEGNVEGSIKWKIGENYSEIKEEIKDLAVWDNYTLNVYETFNGNKKLLASVPTQWSMVTNWIAE
ncbi:hypothetical protein FHS16_004695 [Paenibacillus endophyticus]|uniref:Uncharacterized protein n=1 Tax=Paenibacillus endophyticus TaxID=1294268 RepID=A0A7W5GCM6_9BACL|nr:hypothetical protein [Paenibacillus endophyticus]MBB3154613.1 hypothetical protein [Paenibacillus endophyticus]